MTEIVTATLVVGVIGLLIGMALVAAGKKFYVETDPRESEVRECLPGNNCGACGYAGCDAVAAAIVKGEAAVNACPVCSEEAVKSIGAIMGVEAEAAARRVAFVRCSRDCATAPVKCTYVGLLDCRSAVLADLSIQACSYGCLGFGSCAAVCPQEAIRVKDGLAVVNESKCVGCGLCVEACPNHLIELVPVGRSLAVRCASQDRGPAVRKVCTAGCIGCSLCVKQCDQGAVVLTNNLAHITPDKCIGCGKCADKCPAKVIVRAGIATVTGSKKAS